MKDPLTTALGVLIWAGIIYWLYRRHQKKKLAASAGSVSPDPSVRERAEREMRSRGVIGGSALQAPRGLETAYRRIMQGIIADEKLKTNLYSAWAADQSVTTIEQFLLPGKWQWTEFDKCKEIFRKDGEFPHMWQKYPELCMEDFGNISLEKALERMLVKDIKLLFERLHIEVPSKSKKGDLIEMAEKK